MTAGRKSAIINPAVASVAHLVERHLAKVEVASSSLVTRSKKEDMTYGHVFLFGFRPLCGLHPLEFQCSGGVNSPCAVLPSRFPARLPKA